MNFINQKILTHLVCLTLEKMRQFNQDVDGIVIGLVSFFIYLDGYVREMIGLWNVYGHLFIIILDLTLSMLCCCHKMYGILNLSYILRLVNNCLIAWILLKTCLNTLINENMNMANLTLSIYSRCHTKTSV